MVKILTTEEVIQLFEESKETDWVYDAEDDMWQFKKNLAIHVDWCTLNPGERVLRYAGEDIAIVHVPWTSEWL